jgi:hypothetical protein
MIFSFLCRNFSKTCGEKNKKSRRPLLPAAFDE